MVSRFYSLFLPLTITIILSITSLYCHCQDSVFHYYQLERQARIFKEQNLLDSSLIYYMQAIEFNNECPFSVLNSALKISKKLQNSSATIILKSEIEKRKMNLDSDYLKEINKLFKKDQRSRSSRNMKIQQKYANCISKGDCDEVRMSKYRRALNEWNKTDSLNIYRLISLIETKGFPSENKVGEDGYFKAHIILLHFDRDSNNVLLGPILDSALYRGKLKPRDYAWIIDRRSMSATKQPVYYYIQSPGYEKLSPQEKENIDIQRSRIGLLPVSNSQIVIKTKNGFKVKYTD